MRSYHVFAFNRKGIVSLCAALVASGVLFVPVKGMAQTDISGQNTYTMSDGGSTATVNVVNSGTLGMNSWTVLGGQNQLNQQWFWYSINGVAPQPISAIGTATVYNVNDNPNLNDLAVIYQNAQLEVSVEYTLSGNGVNSGSADMGESLMIVNNSASSIDLSFYQYSNFDLLQNNNNDVSISGSSGAYTGALQTTGGPGGTGIGEVILGPNANYAEAAQVPQTLNELNNPLNSNFNLNDSISASGDVSWAFQWNATLNPGDMLDLTKNKGLSVQIVPEPSTVALVALGVGALGWTLRRKSA
ncbi:MAG: PEP-CTERM sorting domain-containing protein [Verrucomicrobiota bacterium]|jgi:hypothetical protein